MHKIFTILSCLENIKSGEVKTTNFYYNLLKSGVYMYEVGDISKLILHLNSRDPSYEM